MSGESNRAKDVVVITGAAGALGSEVARHLATRGYKPALFDMERSKDRLLALAKETGGAAFTGDIADAATWKDALGKIEASLGAPPSHAALIAGAWQGGKPLHEEDDDVWTKMIATNLETAHRSLRALLPGMVARGRGSVVVVGARGVERPWTNAGSAAYGAAKSAVVALAQAAAAEVLDRGVRINAIMPSTIDTPANRSGMPKADFGKWVAPASIAAVVAFLLSDDARDVSGAAIPVYGRA